MTCSEACEDLDITSGMHWVWKKSIDAMLEAKKNNIKAKSIHSGRESCLTQNKQELLQFIVEHRDKGMVVTVSMVVTKASQLSDEFRVKSKHARYHSARRFIHSQGLVFPLATHKSQRAPAKVAALDYIQNVERPKVLVKQGIRHEDFILNMDQTPIPFTYNARKTIGHIFAWVRTAMNNLPTQMIRNTWRLNNEAEHNKEGSSEDEDSLTGSVDKL
jgi:hypothetical protein